MKLEDLALFEYYSTITGNEPVYESVAVRFKDGFTLAAGTLTIWDATQKHCIKQSADLALYTAASAHYGPHIPQIIQRVRVRQQNDESYAPLITQDLSLT